MADAPGGGENPVKKIIMPPILITPMVAESPKQDSDGLTIGREFIAWDGTGLAQTDVERGTFLGQGAMGKVYRARKKSTGEVLALKAVDLPPEEEEHARRLIGNELHLLLNSECNYVVKCQGCFFESPKVYIGMEFMDAGSIGSLCRAAWAKGMTAPGYITERVLLNIAGSVIHALNYLDRMRAIHRDIKPDNILINRRGEIKVGDLGVSNYRETLCSKGRFQSGVGSQSYLGPERVDPENTRPYDIRSDVWSLGISIIEIAIGRNPYKEKAQDKEGFGLMMKIKNNPPPRLPDTYSPEFIGLIDACLIKNVYEPTNADGSPKAMRATPAELLTHPLLAAFTPDLPAVAAWVESILGPVEAV